MRRRNSRRRRAARLRKLAQAAPAPLIIHRCGARTRWNLRPCQKVVVGPGAHCASHRPAQPKPEPAPRALTRREQFPWALVVYGTSGKTIGEPEFFRTRAAAESARPAAPIKSCVVCILLNAERPTADRRTAPPWAAAVKTMSPLNNRG